MPDAGAAATPVPTGLQVGSLVKLKNITKLKEGWLGEKAVVKSCNKHRAVVMLLDGKQAVINKEGAISNEREFSKGLCIPVAPEEHPTGGSIPGASPSSTGGTNPGDPSSSSSGGPNPGAPVDDPAAAAVAAKQRADALFGLDDGDDELFGSGATLGD